MTAPQRWDALLARQDEFTCYSAAMAVWLAAEREEWAPAINPGLWLTLTEEPGNRLGFSYFPPELRFALRLRRAGADDAADALDGVVCELARSGRVIVAADGFALPWHVACGRQHVPHWFTLVGTPDALAIGDPFACRNELGVQTPELRELDRDGLAALLPALPGTDPIHRLREELAFGDRCAEGLQHRYQWFEADDESHAADGAVPAAGSHGADAIRRLSTHFREHGQDLDAYRQADDIWSIARHRAFTLRYAASLSDSSAGAWADEHGAQLTRRWGHIAPLIMQAVLSLRAGRAASSSVADTLADLAEREAAAAAALPPSLAPGNGCSIGAGTRLQRGGLPGDNSHRGPLV